MEVAQGTVYGASMRSYRALAGLAVLALVLAGCVAPAFLGSDEGAPYPEGCGRYDLSPRRCEAIVAAMAGQLGIDRDAAQRIELLGDPGCGFEPAVLCTRTTSFVVRVRFTLADGSLPEASVFCGVGYQYSILCTEEPEIPISSVTMGGYHDVPCAGEPPDGCATPVPTIDLAAAREARELRLDALEIPLDRVGRYEVVLGRATLPNGILTDASFALADPSPDTFSVGPEGIRLRVRSLEPGGGDLVNIYEHGWRPGVEPVEAVLEFEILERDPDAVLAIRAVVVR